jgi:hypothetical protein
MGEQQRLGDGVNVSRPAPGRRQFQSAWPVRAINKDITGKDVRQDMATAKIWLLK